MDWHIPIYEKYIGRVTLGKLIKTPFRTPKSGVQFNVFRSPKNGRIYWKDHTLDCIHGNDIYGFIAQREGCDRETAVDIVRDMKGDLDPGDFKRNTEFSLDEIKYPITFRTAELTRLHYAYYETLFVERKYLHMYNMLACMAVAKGPKMLFQHSDENFGFHWKFGKNGEKAYLPFHGYWKWSEDNTWIRMSFFHVHLESLEGWEQIDWTADHIIITKSMKDLIVLISCGYNAVCVSGEAIIKILIMLMPILESHFASVMIWFDPDEAGEKGVLKVLREFPGLLMIRSLAFKDPSDIIIGTRSRNLIYKSVNQASRQ